MGGSNDILWVDPGLKHHKGEGGGQLECYVNLI